MNLGMLGYAMALCLAAVGSALGMGAVGRAAIGALKKCYAQNKPAPFMAVMFVGFPLTQTLYGFILMQQMLGLKIEPVKAFAAGLFGGAAMGFSAFMQGKAAASAADSLAETGKGTGIYILILGFIESVALLVMVFLIGALTG